MFEIDIESASVETDPGRTVYSGLIYRVFNDVREERPLQRTDHRPLQIVAASEETAVEIAWNVLREVTGAKLDSMGRCGGSMLPPIPSFAV